MAAEFFRAWVTFSLMVIGGAAVAALLAARAGLFRNQERARHLALYAEVDEAPEVNAAGSPPLPDEKAARE